MPLPPEERRKLVIAQGLDPNKYDYVETGEEEAGLPIPPVIPQGPPTTSGPSAFGQSFLRSLIPTGGMGMGMRAGAALPMIPHPIIGPIGKALGIVGGGLLGSMGAGWGQEKALEKIQGPENYNKGLSNLTQAREQHPIISTAAELAPALPFFGTTEVLRELPKFLQPSRISTKLLGNAALQGTLQGGMEAGREVLQGEDISSSRIGVNTLAGGLLLGGPTALGSKVLGPHFAQPTPEVLNAKSRTPDIEKPFIKTEDITLEPGQNLEGKEIVELQGKPVKPSLATDESQVVKTGEPLARPSGLEEEGINPDSTEKFYQPAKSIGDKLTEEQLVKAKELASKRGVTLEQQPEIFHEKTGEPVMGAAEKTSREAFVSERLATEDTPHHEIGGHKFANDLKTSKLQADRNVFEKGVRAAGSEEALAEAVGKRKVDIDNAPLKTWLEDFWGNTKRLARVGNTTEEEVNALARRYHEDRPYVESPELHSGPVEELQRHYQGEISGVSKTIEPKELSKGFGFLKSAIDKIAEKGPSGKIVAKAFTNTELDNRKLIGQFREQMIGEAQKLKEGEKASRYIWESRFGKPEVDISTEDEAIIRGRLNELYRNVHEEQKSRGLKVKDEEGNLRDPISDPNLMGPSGISEEVLNTLIKSEESSPKRQKLVEDFIKHQIEREGVKTREAALEKLNNLLIGFSPAKEGSTAAFNALRKSEGIGIPWEWMEKNPVKLFQRYGTRVARDLSYWTNIENNAQVSKLLGLEMGKFSPEAIEATKGLSPVTAPEAKVVHRRMMGQHTSQEQLYSAVEHFVRSLILGPATGIKNTISTMAQLLPYVEVRDLPKIIEAFRYIKQGYKDSMLAGVNRHSVTGLETGELGEIGLTRTADNLRHLGDIIRKFTGANAIEQWTRAHNMALGELLTQAHYGRAIKGDVSGKSFLRKFGPEGLDFSKPLSEVDLRETAASFVERVQGTYGARGLPAFLLEPSSPTYWLMNLSKWSVEKSNVIKQDVINPAIQGDYAPLLRYTLGGILTGELIRQVGEQLMGGKKAGTPNLAEVQEKGDWSDYTYKFFELAGLASLGGIFMDGAKAVGDLGKGYQTRGYTMPAVEMTKDIIGEVSAASRAIDEGQNKPAVLSSLILNLITDNIQFARMIGNAANPQEIDRLNKFRDKRVFDKLEGKNIPASTQRQDRYGGKAEREFKRSKSVEEAAEIYSQDIQPRLKLESREDQRDKKSSLKRNSYQTIPAGGKEREAYLSYIRKTQSEEAARALVEDKRKQDLVNRQKQRLVR